jgi:hypothetical protein
MRLAFCSPAMKRQLAPPCQRRSKGEPVATGWFQRWSQYLRSVIMEAMLSSRRLKKGPGRRPLSAKRQKFMELLERRSSIRGAAREVGVSRSSGTNWTGGVKDIRDGVQVGFVPPLDRPH